MAVAICVDARSAVNIALFRLAALDRARNSIGKVRKHLAIAADRAAKVYATIQVGTETFLQTGTLRMSSTGSYAAAAPQPTPPVPVIRSTRTRFATRAG